MRPRLRLVLAAVATSVLSLSACQFGGGTATVTGDSGGCTRITVPSLTLPAAAPSTPTTLPGVVLAPCAPPTTTPPPTTTVQPTTVAPTTTTPPPTTTSAPPPADTAAARLGWGTPLGASDEFNYTGAPDSAKWWPAGECWPGHDGNGRRCASRSTVAGGFLRQTGLSNGDSAWLGNKLGQRYGRWEVRARMAADGATGHAYHPVLLLWPDSEAWPSGGEYDFAETDIGSSGTDAFIHHPTQSGVVQDHYAKTLDITAWHNYAIDWRPGHVTGYVDGQLWFDDTNPAAQAPGPMHGTIQLDNFYGGGMQPAHLDVDWYRTYPA